MFPSRKELYFFIQSGPYVYIPNVFVEHCTSYKDGKFIINIDPIDLSVIIYFHHSQHIITILCTII